MECIWITKTSPTVAEQLRLTDAAMSVFDGANTYAPAAWTRTALPAQSATSARELVITMPRSAWSLTWQADLDFVVSIYRSTSEVVGLDQITATLTRIMLGRILGITFEGSAVQLQVAPVARALSELVGTQQYSQFCRWDLYGTGCGLDPNTYEISGTLSTVVDEVTLESAAFGGLGASYLSGGIIEIGDHVRLIADHDEPASRITIESRFPVLPVALDAFKVWPGCNKTHQICASKFSNVANFGGMPNIPNGDPTKGVWTGVE